MKNGLTVLIERTINIIDLYYIINSQLYYIPEGILYYFTIYQLFTMNNELLYILYTYNKQ